MWFKMNAPFTVIRGNCLIVIHFIADFIAVVFLIVVASQQNHLVKVIAANLPASTRGPVSFIFYCYHYGVTEGLIQKVLIDATSLLSARSPLEVKTLKTIGNQIGLFISVNPAEINLLTPVK